MNSQSIPEKWKPHLSQHVKDVCGEDRNYLQASDFKHNVLLKYEDGTSLFFKHAFYAVDEASLEIAVFTEHCGFHIFPYNGAELELMEPKWTNAFTPDLLSRE